ncbi:MAG: DUF3429 domain-containing protein [Granulosicoccus sp.]
MAAREQVIPTPALVLGVAGLLPFIATALASCTPSNIIELLAGAHSAPALKQLALNALGAYGAVILSFLGGIRWGSLLSDTSRLQQWQPLALSVVPSLIAWPALLLKPSLMLSILVVGFLFQFALDVKAVKRGELPPWFGRLRTILTTGAVLSLLAGLIAHSLFS